MIKNRRKRKKERNNLQGLSEHSVTYFLPPAVYPLPLTWDPLPFNSNALWRGKRGGGENKGMHIA